MKAIFTFLISLTLIEISLAQNVGVGTSSPETKLTVDGAISSKPVDVVASTNAFTLPDNVSIVRITTNSNAAANGAASVANPKEGQYLTIYNSDPQAVTFAGVSILGTSGVASFVYVNSGWRLVSTTNTGTVTSIATGTGLTGGPVTSTGTISMADMAAWSVKGNATNATGAPTDIAAANDNQVLRRSGTSIGFGSINLASSSAVTGTLPIANGGTNSSTALNNNRLMVSSGGAIVESAALTANSPLYTNASGLPTTTAPSSGAIGYWTRSGTNLFNTTLTDNVGIGTNSPASKLDVVGTAQADYLTLDPQNSTNEGGEIQLKGAGSFGNLHIDNFEGNARIFNLGASNSFQILGGGSSLALRVENGGAFVNGSVGIGTSAIPKGSIGAAKLAINGANASANGPHVQYTTDIDNYPVFQQLNYSHGYTFLNFDAYWDGAWKSSAGPNGNTGNFSISQQGNGLRFDYANVNTQGAAITWNSGMILNNTTGNVGIGTESPSNRLHVLANSYNPFTNASSNIFTEGAYGGGILMRDCSKFGGMYMVDCGANMRFNMKSSAGANVDVMTLNEGGNVGIGTTSPAYRFDVSGTGRFGGGSNSSVYLAGGATAGAGGIEIFGSGNVGYIRFHDPNVAWRNIAINDAGGNVGIGTTSFTSKLTVQTSTANDGFYLTNGSRRIHMIPGNVGDNEWNSIVRSGDNVILFSDGNQNNGNLVLAPWVGSNTTRGIRIIGSSGNIGIGTASPDQLLSVNGNAAKSGGGSWATFSDRRVKKDINSFNDGLSVVMNLKPVTFKYNEKSGYSNLDKSYVGFIAQEVEQVAPYMVELYNDTEGTSGLADKRQFDESALTKILVNAIQEQQQQIEDLKQDNTQLKQDNKQLKAALENKANSNDFEKLKAEIQYLKDALLKAAK